MKKILLLSLLVSSTVFAENTPVATPINPVPPESSYVLTTTIYTTHDGNKDLVTSASQVLKNDGKENPTVISREIQAPLRLTEGLNLNSRISRSEMGDVLDYTGQISTITNVSKSEDSKWQEGDVKVINFQTSMILDKDKNVYKSSYDSNDKKYILEIKAEKADNVSEKKE